MAIGHACGKAILFGEHAVVYGRPAIAVPVRQLYAEATVQPAPTGSGITIVAEDLHETYTLAETPPDNPFHLTIVNTLHRLGHDPEGEDLHITIHSTIPIACGLGSGAAVATAIVRALVAHFGAWLPSQDISALVFETEKIHHGTPSGVDNTVIAFEKPVYFVKGHPPEIFWVGRPFHLLIADTGIPSETKAVVQAVRNARQKALEHYEELFDEIATLTDMAREAIEQGNLEALGHLMNANHRLLQQLGVSCPELDSLVAAAQEGGALGAKLSGAGWGGNMIALVTPQRASQIEMLLRMAGARNVILTEVK